ncbi:MAG: DUF4493 domain-containing protein [Bacteroidetes bacterium]|nr:DUF4493 domain-containing protein [Bacteroidota bacterium]
MIKNIIGIIILFVFTSSCSNEVKNEDIGYLEINGINIVNGDFKTKALNEGEDFEISIYNEDNEIVKAYKSYLEILNNNDVIRLFEGNYYIVARSKDIPISGIKCPTYKGISDIFSIERGKTSDVSLMCKLDGIAIKFYVSKEIEEVFSDFEILITPISGDNIIIKKENIDDIIYLIIENQTFYYTINATNIEGESFTIKKKVDVEEAHKYEIEINL